jgi:hypothetical protein
MTNETTDDDRAANRDFAASLFSHPEPDQAGQFDQPAAIDTPIPHDDARQAARDLFSN